MHEGQSLLGNDAGKKFVKSVVFCQTRPTPFFVGKCILAETNFTHSPISKTSKFPLKNGFFSPRFLDPKAIFKAILIAVDVT